MEVYEPSDGNFYNTDDEMVGIVLFNHFGSTVSQDTGRDAQELADEFRMAVLAVDRPGTAGFTPSPQLARDIATPHGYLAEMSILGQKIDRRAETLGFRKVIVTGRSAGGLAALALARSETVSCLRAVYAAEPVACERMPLKKGKHRYTDYLKQQKELLADESQELVRPLPPGLPLFPAIGRLLSIPPAMVFDKFHNKRLFATEAARQYASHIAANMSQIDTTLEFAEHSMVVTPEVYQDKMLPLAKLRRHDGAPFVVKKHPGTVHASFDNRGFMNTVILPTVTRTETPLPCVLQ